MIRFRHGVVLGAVALSLLSGSQVLAAGAGGAGGGPGGGAAGSGSAGAPGGTGSNAGPGAPGSTGGTTPSIPSAGKGGAPSTGTGSPGAPGNAGNAGGQGIPGQGNQGNAGSPGTAAASGSAPGVAPTGGNGGGGGGAGSSTSAAVTVGTGGEMTPFGTTADTTPAPKAEGAVPEGSVLPSSLSLADALRAFRAHGLDLLIADAQVRSAEGAKTAAGAVLNPIVNLGYGRVLNYNSTTACQGVNGAVGGPAIISQGSGCSGNQWTAGLSDNAAIEDIVSGKRGLRQDVAEAALKATRMGRADAERTIAFQVKSAYFQVVLASQQVDFAKEIAGTSNESYQLMKLRYDKGAINEGDFAVLETAKLEADQSYESARQNLRAARVGLGYLLGVRGHIPDFTVDRDTTKFNDPPKLVSATQDALVKDAFTHRPDLVALDFQRQRADAAIALAKRNVVPDISLSAQYTQTGTSGDNAIQPPTLSFGITSGLPIFYQQQGEVRQAEADFDVQSLTKAKTQAQIISDVETAYAGFVTSRSLVRRMEGAETNGRGLLERAKRARDVQKTRFDKGAASLVEYLDAQRTYINVNIEYLTNLTNYWTAVAQLEQATGLELKQ